MPAVRIIRPKKKVERKGAGNGKLGTGRDGASFRLLSLACSFPHSHCPPCTKGTPPRPLTLTPPETARIVPDGTAREGGDDPKFRRARARGVPVHWFGLSNAVYSRSFLTEGAIPVALNCNAYRGMRVSVLLSLRHITRHSLLARVWHGSRAKAIASSG